MWASRSHSVQRRAALRTSVSRSARASSEQKLADVALKYVCAGGIGVIRLLSLPIEIIVITVAVLALLMFVAAASLPILWALRLGFDRWRNPEQAALSDEYWANLGASDGM